MRQAKNRPAKDILKSRMLTLNSAGATRNSPLPSMVGVHLSTCARIALVTEERMARLEDAVTIITGTGGGIGRATALRLAAEGACVGITDIDATLLDETVEMVRAAGGRVVAHAGDIVAPETIDTLTTKVVAAFGHVDGLVNNAGIVLSRPVLDHTIEDFDRVLHVNTWSCLATAKRVVPEMRERGRGSIVNVASVGALVAINELAVYCTSKAAVVGLTRSMALELGPSIRVNALCPGGVDTPMAAEHFTHFPSREAALEVLAGEQIQKRYAAPEELASAILFMLSSEASFMTGAAVSVDGGWSAW
jgi:meso-butanediol dehydrogenase/(S,S)-butanediol dehydrogenase/diacetyl reductase